MPACLPVVLMLVAFSTAWFAFELDESPAGPREWGYRPEPGSTVRRNPPGFSWRPAEEAASYALEIASDQEFARVVYRREETPWPAHCPSRPLPPGNYFWRYAATNADGERTGWSRARGFAVPADAVEFPRPGLPTLIERMPSEHPRLFFRPEEIDPLRAAARGELAEQWAELKSRAEGLLEEPPETSEPPLYPDDIEDRGEKWKRIWWGNRRRVIAVANGAATLAFVYRVSGNERYGRAARRLLMAMCEWDPEGSTAYRYNDEAAMPALYFTSRAYDWVHPLLSGGDRDRVVAMMGARGRQAFEYLRERRHLWRPYESHRNRAWHFLGEVAVAFHGDIPEADRWLDYAMTVFYNAYPVWGDDRGGWHEGVSYWASYMRRFMYWAQVMQAAFGIDTFQRPFFRGTGYYGMYVLPPGTRHGGLADMAVHSRSGRIAPLMAQLAVGARNPHWFWFAREAGFDGIGGYLGFLFAWRAAGLELEPPAELPSSICFPGVGLAVLNSNLLDGDSNVQLFFKSSPMGTISHGFNANNAFHLNVHGRPMLLNTGRRDIHGSPHHRNWMWHTKSQNAILVDGRGQHKHSLQAQGRISHFQASPEVDVVVGEAGDSYENLDRWTRRVVFLRPDVFVIHDLLESPQPSTYRWLLHAPGQFELEEAAARYDRGDASVTVRFLVPEAPQLSQTSRFEPPPAEWAFELDQWHLTARTPEPALTQQFLTLMSIGDPAVSWELTGRPGSRELTLQAGDRGAELKLARGEFSVRYGDFHGRFSRGR